MKYRNLSMETVSFSTETALVPVVKILETSERQTIVHCSIDAEMAYRIWPSTFLIERGSGKRAKLITAFNISFAPEWTLSSSGGFTLIFEGLSRECRVFDLIEDIPQEGGFKATGIVRNESDVYHLSF